MNGPMDILRAQKIAQDRMLEGGDWNREFEVEVFGSRVRCEWEDPYFGLFRIKGATDDKVILASSLPADVEAWT